MLFRGLKMVQMSKIIPKPPEDEQDKIQAVRRWIRYHQKNDFFKQVPDLEDGWKESKETFDTITDALDCMLDKICADGVDDVNGDVHVVNGGMGVHDVNGDLHVVDGGMGVDGVNGDVHVVDGGMGVDGVNRDVQDQSDSYNSEV